MAEQELRFNCSFRWHVSVDDDIELEKADTEKGKVIRATPKTAGDTLALAFNIQEHVVLVKNLGPSMGKDEWSLRLAKDIDVVNVGSKVDLTLKCDPGFNIFPVDLAVPAGETADGRKIAATVFALSPIPFVDQQISGLQFGRIDAADDEDGSVQS